MYIAVSNCRSYSYLLLVILYVNKSWSKSHNHMCGDYQGLIGPRGTISSPPIPMFYRHEIICTWHILGPPQSTLKIHIKSLKIPDDPGCNHSPCCHYNYVSLPVNGKPGEYQQVCGNVSQSVISVSQNHTTITFKYTPIPPPSQEMEATIKWNGRDAYSTLFEHTPSFRLIYNFEKNVCDGKFRCRDGSTCLHKSQRCDNIRQCPDGDDEMLCSESSKCGYDEYLCGLASDHCYKRSDMCDDLFQCPFGEDESGCSPDCEFAIKCLDGKGCYSPFQRCDGHSDCSDDSDEAMCSDDLCPLFPNKRQCRNGRCIQAKLWCDGNDDCGDFSDEEACLKNSMITLAMMCALLGGLVLVLVVGCSLRIYSRRYTSNQDCRLRLSPPGGSHLRMPHSLSLPALIDNEFFHREPPPMYSVAVGNAGIPRRSRGNRNRGPSRRSNYSHRHTVAVPVPKPPSEITLHDSSSPSSEDSLMSSSNVPVTNTDDSEQLISA